MANSDNLKITYFEPRIAARGLKQVGVDYLNVESQNIMSRWYHGPNDVDLFIWTDSNQKIIKQQLTFCGQVVEWNVLDGIKTGVVIEEGAEDSKESRQESIRFDKRPQAEAVSVAITLIKNADAMDADTQVEFLSNLMRQDLPEYNLPKGPSVWAAALDWIKSLFNRKK